MNDVVQAVERSFRNLLRNKRYRSITVKDICEDAHISRKTFYANFRDKEDIISFIFERDVVKPLRDINSLFTVNEASNMTEMIQTKIFRVIYDDREYYRNLVVSMMGRDDTFVRVASQALYAYDRKVLEHAGFKGDAEHADYVAYFYSSSQAMMMQKWICDDFSLAIEDIARLYMSMSLNFWGSSSHFDMP